MSGFFGRLFGKSPSAPGQHGPSANEVTDADMLSPLESRRRAYLLSKGLNVDALLARFLSQMQQTPVPDFRAAVAMVVTLGWFAVPGLQRLLLHDKGEVRQLAKQLLLKIQEF